MELIGQLQRTGEFRLSSRRHTSPLRSGIDCGLDASGDLVVFEVNASMLVHDQNADFPCKGTFVRNIKLAFDAMLQRRATKTRGCSAPVG